MWCYLHLWWYFLFLTLLHFLFQVFFSCFLVLLPQSPPSAGCQDRRKGRRHTKYKDCTNRHRLKRIPLQIQLQIQIQIQRLQKQTQIEIDLITKTKTNTKTAKTDQLPMGQALHYNLLFYHGNYWFSGSKVSIVMVTYIHHHCPDIISKHIKYIMFPVPPNHADQIFKLLNSVMWIGHVLTK